MPNCFVDAFIRSQVLISAFLVSSQFRYTSTAIAAKAATPATAATTGADIPAIAVASLPSNGNTVPMADVILPNTTNTGPNAAAIPAVITIVFCIEGLKLEKALTAF